jgi:phosphoadenosine phosphosulfate reductase
MDIKYYCRMNVSQLNKNIAHLSVLEGLMWLGKNFHRSVKFSTAFGLEDQVITHLIGKSKLPIEIFTLDTGRLFQETYDVMELTRSQYNLPIASYYPNQIKLQNMVTAKGPNSFYRSVENRKECCFVRKIEPLKRALANTKVWVTGIRSDQSNNRKQMEVVEWDEQLQVLKYNPLLNWSLEEVEAFLAVNHVPTNVLHTKGYPSIGCLPCTRAIMPGEDVRAGRWWWESSSKECGLHTTKEIDQAGENVVNSN